MKTQTLTNDDKLDIIRMTADEIGGELYKGYSGRGMFGAECVGITCDDPQEAIEEAASRGLRGADWDNLGRQYIVYWPSVKPA